MPASPTESAWRTLGRQLLHGLADIVYPAVCCFCGKPLAEDESRFCTPCVNQLTNDPHESCPRCAGTIGPFSVVDEGCPSCRRWPLHFEAAYRLGPHETALRQAILRMKDRDGEDLADALGRLWAERIFERLKEHQPAAVAPVALHWIRRLQRGYNQAATLGQVLANRLGVACLAGMLWRTRNTPHQVGLSVSARQENVKGAFKASMRKDLREKTIVLVDDVMTTGSTCSEAAKALKQAGAGRIIVAVLAKAST